MLTETTIHFDECNDESRPKYSTVLSVRVGLDLCDKWHENAYNGVQVEAPDWRNVSSLRCAFVSDPGDCPLTDFADARVPRDYALECRCNDTLCILKASVGALHPNTSR